LAFRPGRYIEVYQHMSGVRKQAFQAAFARPLLEMLRRFVLVVSPAADADQSSVELARKFKAMDARRAAGQRLGIESGRLHA
jgi:hypothetical protein